jgi:hypothetical protein
MKIKWPQWAGTLLAGTLLLFTATSATHLVSALPPFHPVRWEMENGDRCYAFAGRLSCFQVKKECE